MMHCTIATFGELAEFRAAFNVNRGSVTLIYGNRRKKRTRRKPGVVGGGGGGGKTGSSIAGGGPVSREAQGVPKPVAKPSYNSQDNRKRAWEIARSRIKGRFKDFIIPPLDNSADLSRKPTSSTSGWRRKETVR